MLPSIEWSAFSSFPFFAIAFVTAGALCSCASPFDRQVRQHRADYRAHFLADPRSPLTEADLSRLDFYAPDEAYRITADIELVADAEPFELATYAGTTKPYVEYAVAAFTLNGAPRRLTLYRSLAQARMPQYRDHLFLPFKDHTNGDSTYGGGRYLDFRLGDIRNGQLVIDFNRAYNPYCAYGDGYQCPIPPPENHLETTVEAGERVYKPKS